MRARRTVVVVRLEAARAKRQEAAEGRRRQDAEAEGHDKMARRGRPRSQSKRACHGVRHGDSLFFSVFCGFGEEDQLQQSS